LDTDAVTKQENIMGYRAKTKTQAAARRQLRRKK
jgi:hypothetical protein